MSWQQPPPSQYTPAPQPAGPMPTFEYVPHRWFDTGFVVMLNLAALVVMLLVTGVFLGFIILGIVLIAVGGEESSIVMILLGILFLILAFPAYLIPYPIGQLNPYVTSVAKKNAPVSYDPARCYVCQATFSPRVQNGIQAVLDDADDIGVLTFEDDQISFHGGFCKFTIPYTAITRMESKFNLFPGLMMSGRRIHLQMATPDPLVVGRVQLEHRQGWTIIDQFRRSLRLIAEFRSRMPNVPYYAKFL